MGTLLIVSMQCFVPGEVLSDPGAIDYTFLQVLLIVRVGGPERASVHTACARGW